MKLPFRFLPAAAFGMVLLTSCATTAFEVPKIGTRFEDTKKNQAIAKKAAMESDQTIEEGKKEAERIVNSAKAQAEHEASRIIAEAKEEAIARRKKTDQDIEDAKRASDEEVRQQIIDVAMLASSTVLGREVSSEDNKRLVDDFVAEMKEKEE